MKIRNMYLAPGRTGFFFDDQRAIKSGAVADGAAYHGIPKTEGFSAIRQAGESVSVILELDDGQLAFGDCAAVQYSGAGGRDPLFLADQFMPVIERELRPVLVGSQLFDFRTLAYRVDQHVDQTSGRHLHTAIRYGVTQALLHAVALSKHCMMADVIAEEYGTTLSKKPIPVFMQSGDNRYDNADKMILKGADILPHGLINHVDTKLGRDGGLLIEYIQWLRHRVEKLRAVPEYMPVLHLDVYGTIGMIFDQNTDAMATYLGRLCEAANPLRLRIEGPMDVEHRERQIEALAALTHRVDQLGIPVELVADEWCNTLEDIRDFADARAGHMIQIKTPDLGGIQNVVESVLYCKDKGIGAYQGGTCNETDNSARTCVHLAMATSPDQILAKPGMGVDEGYMIVYNEMQRILAVAAGRGTFHG